MSDLILVRHCRTDWDIQERIQGRLDIPLNKEGSEEAKKLSEKLADYNIDVIYSSTSSCSIRTAEEIAKARNIRVKPIQALNEIDFGLWQGLLIEDIRSRYKKQYNIWKEKPSLVKLPRGEAVSNAYKRVVNAINKIMDKHRDENVCLVSHNIILSLIKCYLKGLDIDSVSESMRTEGWWEVISL